MLRVDLNGFPPEKNDRLGRTRVWGVERPFVSKNEGVRNIFFTKRKFFTAVFHTA